MAKTGRRGGEGEREGGRGGGRERGEKEGGEVRRVGGEWGEMVLP